MTVLVQCMAPVDPPLSVLSSGILQKSLPEVPVPKGISSSSPLLLCAGHVGVLVWSLLLELLMHECDIVCVGVGVYV